MKKFIAIVLLVSLFPFLTARADTSTPPVASASPSASSSDTGKIAPIKKGNPSPFDGVVLSERAAASVFVSLSTIDTAAKIEADRARRAAEAQCTFELSSLSASASASARIAAAKLDLEIAKSVQLEERLKKTSPGFDPMLAGMIGLGTGMVLSTVIAVVIASSIK